MTCWYIVTVIPPSVSPVSNASILTLVSMMYYIYSLHRIFKCNPLTSIMAMIFHGIIKMVSLSRGKIDSSTTSSASTSRGSIFTHAYTGAHMIHNKITHSIRVQRSFFASRSIVSKIFFFLRSLFFIFFFVPSSLRWFVGVWSIHATLHRMHSWMIQFDSKSIHYSYKNYSSMIVNTILLSC